MRPFGAARIFLQGGLHSDKYGVYEKLAQQPGRLDVQFRHLLSRPGRGRSTRHAGHFP